MSSDSYRSFNALWVDQGGPIVIVEAADVKNLGAILDRNKGHGIQVLYP